MKNRQRLGTSSLAVHDKASPSRGDCVLGMLAGPHKVREAELKVPRHLSLQSAPLLETAAWTSSEWEVNLVSILKVTSKGMGSTDGVVVR